MRVQGGRLCGPFRAGRTPAGAGSRAAFDCPGSRVVAAAARFAPHCQEKSKSGGRRRPSIATCVRRASGLASHRRHDKEPRDGIPHREGLPGREADSRRRLLRRADAARQGELPHHRHPDVAGAELRQGVRLREEGRGARQPRPRRARRQDRRRDRQGVRQADRRRDARPVRHRLHPGRRRHVDQHERQRGDRQPRAGSRWDTRRASTSTSTRTTTSTSGSRPTTCTRPRSGSR